jgi:hypothetical protein
MYCRSNRRGSPHFVPIKGARFVHVPNSNDRLYGKKKYHDLTQAIATPKPVAALFV